MQIRQQYLAIVTTAERGDFVVEKMFKFCTFFRTILTVSVERDGTNDGGRADNDVPAN